MAVSGTYDVLFDRVKLDSGAAIGDLDFYLSLPGFWVGERVWLRFGSVALTRWPRHSEHVQVEIHTRSRISARCTPACRRSDICSTRQPRRSTGFSPRKAITEVTSNFSLGP
jgi:hypothetical protein